MAAAADAARPAAAPAQGAPGTPPGAQTQHPGTQHPDGSTRHTVARLLLEQGPVTAAAVAEELGLSPAAVRRHLDALVADGEACTRDAPRRGRRGRGRPAKLFLLTEAGRARFGHAYDDLAVAALRFLAEHAGEEAVRSFAERRIGALVDRHRAAVTARRGADERAKALATALTREGYAASARRVGMGEQLCQHHCPVAHVAAEFPQLCEAETAAFAELLGTHVQRLATIARGDAACTTHVPLGEAPATEDAERASAAADAPAADHPTCPEPTADGAPQEAGETARIPARDPHAGSSHGQRDLAGSSHQREGEPA
ncbi:helix-turn-helix transcriptional regulator [Streptoalloteichus hindustanus]|uniref:helix-turn-helix transcriptional regulator n=1 Tax=Streptoalloteichus hindustanus TaxID=2017 RepID=UPI001160FB11